MISRPARALFLTLLVAACSKSGNSQSNASPASSAQPPFEDSGDIDKNQTPLPTYPHLVKANMLSVPNQNGCIEYMSSTSDKLSDAVTWYRTKLGGAKETPFTGDYQGVDFTVNGTDHVMVFALGNTGTSITMMHATTGKSCGRGNGQPG
jgi:hypothetical protein